jgi:hypothetical protein
MPLLRAAVNGMELQTDTVEATSCSCRIFVQRIFTLGLLPKDTESRAQLINRRARRRTHGFFYSDTSRDPSPSNAARPAGRLAYVHKLPTNPTNAAGRQMVPSPAVPRPVAKLGDRETSGGDAGVSRRGYANAT